METKHALQVLFEQIDIETGNARPRSYSGRGMYGKECLGVTGAQGLGELFGLVLEQMVNEALDHDEGDVSGESLPDKLHQVQTAFRNMRSDSMGLGMIYYFPGVPYVKDETGEV